MQPDSDVSVRDSKPVGDFRLGDGLHVEAEDIPVERIEPLNRRFEARQAIVWFCVRVRIDDSILVLKLIFPMPWQFASSSVAQHVLGDGKEPRLGISLQLVLFQERYADLLDNILGRVPASMLVDEALQSRDEV
jgi:hypothetical protein